VRTQLSLALVALVAHMGAEHWQGMSAVQFLAKRYTAEAQGVALPCLLELLLLLPQESQGYPSMRPGTRRAFMAGLLQATGDALQLLTSCLSTPHTPRMRCQVRIQRQQSSDCAFHTFHTTGSAEQYTNLGTLAASLQNARAESSLSQLRDKASEFNIREDQSLSEFEPCPYSMAESMGVVDGSSQIVEAYGAWVRLSAGGAGEREDGEREDGARTLPAAELIASHPLTAATLEGLGVEETYDVAVDTCSELIRSTRIGDPERETVDPVQLPLVQVWVSVNSCTRPSCMKGDPGARTANGFQKVTCTSCGIPAITRL
jgi:hypothetical protein